MRKVFTICSLLLFFMVLTPVIISLITGKTIIKTQEIKIDANNINKRGVIVDVINMASENFCDESLKAVIAIAKNNRSLNPADSNKDKLNNNTNQKFYQRIEKLYNESDINISYKGKYVYIPTARLSAGFTKTSQQHPYIKSVASPWDCENEDFIYKKDYQAGISLAGVDYLCSKGMNAKEALRWYLPDFDIK